MTGMSTPSPRGYVLENQVTHARLLPTASKHAFVYPSLSLLLSLDALENHSLDLARGWIFGYGGRWARLVGLRPDPYLTPDGGSLRQRLETVLRDRGFAGELDDAWVMTMPSLLGFEGINPLTVYFCYRPGGELFMTVLEVHNTFGEAHVYCLEPNKDEEKPARGFDHQWTFPRAFHVSPFNDRSGFYTVSVSRPSHSPSGVSTSSKPPPPPRPTVRVHLHTQSDDPAVPGPLKLTALLRPTAVAPLTTPSLLAALARAPLSLFLSFARIAYVAWVLHYVKRLDVFPRPAPIPPSPSNSIPADTVRHLPAGALEAYAQRRVHEFLAQRVAKADVRVTLVPTDPDPARRRVTFSPVLPHPDVPLKDIPTLTIRYTAPLLFALLLRAPSPQHALLLGKADGVFAVNDEALFCTTFASAYTANGTSCRQRLRAGALGGALPQLPIPARHPLDSPRTDPLGALLGAAVLCALLFLERAEAWVFRAARARVVPGAEPWAQWERAAGGVRGLWDGSGSVRSEG
ncbi:hypothetical protein DFH09DRAFT_1030747 [Mycena vulgaris]|nr:hypothetical protein DFH09DRAFT_1030747 [Mycena vulgaris]